MNTFDLHGFQTAHDDYDPVVLLHGIKIRMRAAPRLAGLH